MCCADGVVVDFELSHQRTIHEKKQWAVPKSVAFDLLKGAVG